MTQYCKVLLLILLIVNLKSLTAQTDSSTLDDRDFTIVGGKFVPKLQNSEKINTTPTQEQVETKKPIFEYDIAKQQAATNRVATPMAPLSYVSKERQDWRGNYFKAGFGNFNMPLLEAYLFNLKDDELIYGAELKHLSANNSSNFQDFSQNTVKLYGARILKNNQFTVNLAYDRHAYRRYGFDSSEFDFSKNDVFRGFEDWNGSFKFNRLRGRKKAPKLGFLLDFHSFNTSDQARESSIAGVIDFRMRAFEGEILADLGILHTKYTAPNRFQERVFVDFFPRYTFAHPKQDLDITAGFKVNYIPAGVDSTLFVIPHLEARYHLIKDYVVLFGGFTGGIDKTLLRTQAFHNPFITDTFTLISSVTNIQGNLGFEGKLTKNIEFLGEIVYAEIDNVPLYITNPDTVNSFRVIYDNGSILSFKAQLGYTFSTKIRAYILARINQYTFDNQQAWQLPTEEVRARFQYNIANKIYTTAEAIFWGDRPHIRLNGAPETMNSFADFNLHVDYRYKKHLSFFAHFNNISSSRIQRWYNHPVYSLNILAGVNFSF